MQKVLFSLYSYRPVEMKNFWGGGGWGVGAGGSSKILANLVSWRRTSFSWNCLTLTWWEIKGFVLKPEIWYVSTQTDLTSENIPFSTKNSLILLMSADHASRVRILDCFKLAINWKMTMTSLYVDKASSSSFLTLPCFFSQV